MRAIASVTGAFFLAAVSPLDAASLRSTPVNISVHNMSVENTNEALDAVMGLVGSIQAQHEQEKPRPQELAGNGTRPKLDVGFTQYEQNLTESLASTISEAVPMWDNTTRQNMIANVTRNVSMELKNNLKPVKQAIGKTWMVLPEDAQVAYAAQLKQSFQSVFADSLNKVYGHTRRIKALVDIEMKKRKPLPHNQLLQKVESFYIQAVALDHCYGDAELIQMSLLELVDSSESMVVEEMASQNTTGNQTHKLKKFCLKSLLANLADRLKDAQGLLSMSMRFEAHVPIDMIQTRKQA